ncbi:MAG: sensor histidine kinase [Paraclostridium sp.]|uniref:sensor histidine kinase n=1 Tax=Paraclostridium sp. TaxID=2023273 RepID=UPI003F2FE644
MHLHNISIKRQVKNITNYLDNIDNYKTRSKLEVTFNNKEIENLAIKVNTVIKDKQEIIESTREQEDKLKVFIASISHDLRTPLTSIKGYIQLIRDKELNLNERNYYLRVINDKIVTLNKLINDFFELSIYDSNEYELNLEKINFNSFMLDVVMDNYEDFKNKDIVPTINIEDKPIYILGDKVGCQRIVQNLISNSIKYTKESVDINVHLKEGYCYFSISNRVDGIDQEEISRIFDRFYRIDKSRSNQGTGIGLYIVKVLIEKLDWKIEAKNSEDNMISIEIVIPIFEV